jgi:uncharacterized protein (TIGR03067 family)
MILAGISYSYIKFNFTFAGHCGCDAQYFPDVFVIAMSGCNPVKRERRFFMIGKLLLLLSVGYFAFTPLSNYQTEQDWKMVEGTWIPLNAELGGQKLPDEYLKDTKLILSAGRYTYMTDQGTYKLIPVEAPKAPKAIDITGVDGPNKGKTLLAIYELTGDTLRVCYDLEGKLRPQEFMTRAGTQQLLVNYKKAKN